MSAMDEALDRLDGSLSSLEIELYNARTIAEVPMSDRVATGPSLLEYSERRRFPTEDDWQFVMLEELWSRS